MTDEAIKERETFASDSDDLALTTAKTAAEESDGTESDADGDQGTSEVCAVWYSKMLQDLTLCQLAIRLRSYDHCISICRSWLSEFTVANVVGTMAVAFGSFDCVSHLRKRKPDRALLSSQILMSLTFNEAAAPINNAVSLVLKGGEALCYAWNQDYAQALSSFEMASKCAKDMHEASHSGINALALIQSFDHMAHLVSKAAEIKHRPLVKKYAIEVKRVEVETVQALADDDASAPVDLEASSRPSSSGSSRPSSSASSRPTSAQGAADDVGLGVNVKKCTGGWMILKVAVHRSRYARECSVTHARAGA